MRWQLLDGVPEEDVKRTLALARRRTFARDEVVFHEADPGDCVHLIESGRVAVRIVTPHGQRATLAVIGPGDAFGELGPDARRTASIVTLEATVTLSIQAVDFRRLRSERPEVAEVLIVLLTAQIRRLSTQLLDALYTPADSRVRKRLLELADTYGSADGDVLVPLRQEDLAELAGTSRATVNRVLREEAERGTVRLERGRTRVLDRARISERVW
jgi:CRP/FNR family transcriptional regulator, cyclic AMP receptor protein